MSEAGRGAVADQAADRRSMLALYRDLVGARDHLAGPLRLLEGGPDGVLAFRRGEHLVALNLGIGPAPAPPAGALVRHTHDPDRSTAPATLAAGDGFLAHA